MRDFTLQFLSSGKALFISDVVLDEVTRAPQSLRDQLVAELNSRAPSLLPLTDECRALANAYIAAEIVPAKKRDDALHVATATVHEIDIVVSWNHRHIANLRKSEKYQAINLFEGYSHTPLICTPVMVLDG